MSEESFATDMAFENMKNDAIISCPLTGEILETFDDMAASLLRIKSQQGRLYDAARLIKDRIALLAPGEKKTEFVRGTEYKAEITKADVSWSQPLLKELWKTMPEALRDEILRVSEIGVNARPWGTWQKTAGDETFELWKSRVNAACLGVQGSPSVKIVELEQKTPF